MYISNSSVTKQKTKTSLQKTQQTNQTKNGKKKKKINKITGWNEL